MSGVQGCRAVGGGDSVTDLPKPEDILTPEQLASRLQVPLKWIYQHTERRLSKPLPALRCGRFLRFSWPEVVAWLRSNSV